MTQFFKGMRPQVYLHAAKLRRDKKTGKRLWTLQLINSLGVDQALACGDEIESCYAYILQLNNRAVDVLIDLMHPAVIVDFFAQIDDATPAVHLERLDLGGFRITREKDTAELWFQFETENSAGLHAFVKEYAFTRFWAAFTLTQPGLALQPATVELKSTRKEKKK